MGSFRRTTVVMMTSLIAAGCGGDGGNGPSGGPTAAFSVPSCTINQPCTFTDASTAPAGRTIASRNWTFENGTPATSTESPVQVTFNTGGAQTVTLTVTDNTGETGQVSHDVTVSTPTVLTAAFTFNCISLDCTFDDVSTPGSGGAITAWDWDFDDGTLHSTEQNPSHSYSVPALTTFQVTLTVTNASGTNTVTKDVTVAPPATLTCGSTPDCSLLIEVPAKVTVTLESSECQLEGNTFKVIITPPGGGTPVEEILFTDGCNQTTNPPGTSFQLQSDATFAAGTEIKAQVISGGVNLEVPPAIRVSGSFAAGWLLEFDDGAKAVEPPAPGPDFNDLVIRVVATPQ
jgi:PKD repeat protein